MADNTLEAILTRIKREFRQEIIDTVNTKISIDLLNYYNKTETYTKLEVNNLISNINTLKMEIVSELPTEGIDTSTIYLLPQGVPSENNIYDEYIYINQWELIGSTGIDLTTLVTNQEFQEATDGIWEQINTNTAKISTNTAKISTAESNISTNTTDISGLKTRMNTAESNISTNTENISTNTTDISGLKTRMNTAEGRLDNVDKNIVISTKPFETDCFIKDSANSKIKFDKIIGGLVQEGEPSLANPSELKYVGGNYDIEICNKNLFNNVFIQGQYDIGGAGAIVNISNRIRSDKIKVLPNTTYIISSNNSNINYIGIGGWDINGTLVQKVNNGTWNSFPVSFTTNSDVEYLSFNFRKDDNSDIIPNGDYQIQLEQGTQATSYIKHQEQIYPLDLTGTNLFDKSKVKLGYYLDNNGDLIKQSNSWYCEKYIEVRSDTNYYLSGMNTNIYRICFYTANKTFISRIADTLNEKSFITPSNAKYIRVSGNYESEILDYNTCMINKGTSALPYVPYGTNKFPLYSKNDYIYKKNGKWYVHNEWKKIILDGTINKFTNNANAINNNQYLIPAIDDILKPQSNSDEVKLYSNYFSSTSANNIYSNDIEGIAIDMVGEINIGFGLGSGIDTLELANAKLQELYNAGTPVEIIYPLATTTETKITNATLINQLEAIYNMKTYKGGTHITFDDIGKIKGEYVVDNGLAEAVQEFNEINGYADEAQVTENININTVDISNLKSKVNTLDTNKVNKAGDIMTGNLFISKSSEPIVGVTNGTRKIVLMIGSGGVNRGIHDSIDGAWIIYKDEANLNTPLPFKTAAGEVKYTDKSSIKYNSTDECIEFIFN